MQEIARLRFAGPQAIDSRVAPVRRIAAFPILSLKQLLLPADSYHVECPRAMLTLRSGPEFFAAIETAQVKFIRRLCSRLQQ